MRPNLQSLAPFFDKTQVIDDDDEIPTAFASSKIKALGNLNMKFTKEQIERIALKKNFMKATTLGASLNSSKLTSNINNGFNKKTFGRMKTDCHDTEVLEPSIPKATFPSFKRIKTKGDVVTGSRRHI